MLFLQFNQTESPLHYAVLKSDKEQVAKLLSAESVLALDKKYGISAFAVAVELENEDITRMFIDFTKKQDSNDNNNNANDGLTSLEKMMMAGGLRLRRSPLAHAKDNPILVSLITPTLRSIIEKYKAKKLFCAKNTEAKDKAKIALIAYDLAKHYWQRMDCKMSDDALNIATDITTNIKNMPAIQAPLICCHAFLMFVRFGDKIDLTQQTQEGLDLLQTSFELFGKTVSSNYFFAFAILDAIWCVGFTQEGTSYITNYCQNLSAELKKYIAQFITENYQGFSVYQKYVFMRTFISSCKFDETFLLTYLKEVEFIEEMNKKYIFHLGEFNSAYREDFEPERFLLRILPALQCAKEMRDYDLIRSQSSLYSKLEDRYHINDSTKKYDELIKFLREISPLFIELRRIDVIAFIAHFIQLRLNAGKKSDPVKLEKLRALAFIQTQYLAALGLVDRYEISVEHYLRLIEGMTYGSSKKNPTVFFNDFPELQKEHIELKTWINNFNIQNPIVLILLYRHFSFIEIRNKNVKLSISYLKSSVALVLANKDKVGSTINSYFIFTELSLLLSTAYQGKYKLSESEEVQYLNCALQSFNGDYNDKSLNGFKDYILELINFCNFCIATYTSDNVAHLIFLNIIKLRACDRAPHTHLKKQKPELIKLILKKLNILLTQKVSDETKLNMLDTCWQSFSKIKADYKDVAKLLKLYVEYMKQHVEFSSSLLSLVVTNMPVLSSLDTPDLLSMLKIILFAVLERNYILEKLEVKIEALFNTISEVDIEGDVDIIKLKLRFANTLYANNLYNKAIEYYEDIITSIDENTLILLNEELPFVEKLRAYYFAELKTANDNQAWLEAINLCEKIMALSSDADEITQLIISKIYFYTEIASERLQYRHFAKAEKYFSIALDMLSEAKLIVPELEIFISQKIQQTKEATEKFNEDLIKTNKSIQISNNKQITEEINTVRHINPKTSRQVNKSSVSQKNMTSPKVTYPTFWSSKMRMSKDTLKSKFLGNQSKGLYTIFDPSKSEIQQLKKNNPYLYRQFRQKIEDAHVGSIKYLSTMGIWEVKVRGSRSRVLGQVHKDKNGQDYLVFDSYSKTGFHREK